MGIILSVYLENEKARVAELVVGKKATTVNNVFEVALPEGAVDDGTVLDVEETAGALRNAFRYNKIKKARLAFVVFSKKIANKEVMLPYMKSLAKVEEAVMANVDDYFPMNNLEDYVIRHSVLDTVENAEGKFYNVQIMAFQKEMVQSYYQLADALKMPIETVEYYSNAIFQLLQKQLSQGTVLALQMDREFTYVSIMNGKTQLFKRSIPYGRDTIIKNLAEYRRIDEEEAEEIITDPQKLDLELTPDEYGEVIQDFSSSVTRVVEFHTSRNPQVAVELVKVMGSGIGLIGFSEILSRELGVDAQMVKEIAGVKVSKKSGLNYERIVDYLPNIGALISPLNLKVEEEKEAGKKGGAFLFFILLALVVNAAVAAFFIWTYKNLTTYKDNLKKEIASIQGAEAAYITYNNAMDDYKTVKEYYNSTRNNNEMLYNLIIDLEEIMPESVGITNMSAEEGMVSVTGLAGGKEALAKFIIELKKLDYVGGVHLENTADTYDDAGRATVSFNMTFYLMLPAEGTLADANAEGTPAEGTPAEGEQTENAEGGTNE